TVGQRGDHALIHLLGVGSKLLKPRALWRGHDDGEIVLVGERRGAFWIQEPQSRAGRARFDTPPVGEVVETVVRADPTRHPRQPRDGRTAAIGANHEPGTDRLGRAVRILDPNAGGASVFA